MPIPKGDKDSKRNNKEDSLEKTERSFSLPVPKEKPLVLDDSYEELIEDNEETFSFEPIELDEKEEVMSGNTESSFEDDGSDSYIISEDLDNSSLSSGDDYETLPKEIENAPEDFSGLSHVDEDDTEDNSDKKEFKAPSLKELTHILFFVISKILVPFNFIANIILKPFSKLIKKTEKDISKFASYFLCLLVLLVAPIFILVKINTSFSLPVTQEFPDMGKIEMSGYSINENSVTVKLKNTGEIQQDVIAYVDVSSSKVLNPFTWFSKEAVAKCESDVIETYVGDEQEVTLTCDKEIKGSGISFTGSLK